LGNSEAEETGRLQNIYSKELNFIWKAYQGKNVLINSSKAV
jgi:hypothetical protein